MDLAAVTKYVVGVALLVAPVYYIWWPRWRTRGWRVTTARVIELDAQSVFEPGTYYPNLDSDYAIEYEVDGRSYVQTPDIENNVRVGGFKVAREPSIPREFQIRYDAHDPSKYSIAHAYSPVTVWAVTILSMLAGVLVLALGA